MSEHKEVKSCKHSMTGNTNDSRNNIELWVIYGLRLPDAKKLWYETNPCELKMEKMCNMRLLHNHMMILRNDESVSAMITNKTIFLNTSWESLHVTKT